MPPLPPPNTLAQLEEACRRLEEVSKPPKQRYGPKPPTSLSSPNAGSSFFYLNGLMCDLMNPIVTSLQMD